MTAAAPITEPDTLLTLAQLADRVGVPHAQARDWVRRGGLVAAHGTGRRCVYSLAAGKKLAGMYFERKAKR